MAERYEFVFGDVFDADDELAQWIVAMSMGVNDVLLSAKRLAERLDADAPEHENVYDARLAGMHARSRRPVRSGERHDRLLQQANGLRSSAVPLPSS